MNKFVISGLVSGGVGITCAASGAAVLHGIGRRAAEEDGMVPVRTDYSEPHFFNLIELRTVIAENDCVRDFVGDVDFDKAGSAVSHHSGIGLEKPTRDSDYKGCVVVTWSKNKHRDNRWNGTLNWLWILRSGTRGFVLATMANAVSEGQLQFDGMLYYLEGDAEGAWTVKHHLRMDRGKTANVSDLQNFIPAPHSSNPVAAEAGTHWGFLSSASDLNSICDPKSCSDSETGASSDTKTWSLEKNSDETLTETKALKEWCKDLKWWDSLYGDSRFNLSKTLEHLRGTWRNGLASSESPQHTSS